MHRTLGVFLNAFPVALCRRVPLPLQMTLELFSADINRFALTTFFFCIFSAEVREANCIIIAMSRYVCALDIMGEFRELVGIGIELRDFCPAGSVVARSFSFFPPDPRSVHSFAVLKRVAL